MLNITKQTPTHRRKKLTRLHVELSKFSVKSMKHGKAVTGVAEIFCLGRLSFRWTSFLQKRLKTWRPFFLRKSCRIQGSLFFMCMYTGLTERRGAENRMSSGGEERWNESRSTCGAGIPKQERSGELTCSSLNYIMQVYRLRYKELHF
jgi:hypothetical protein